MRNQTWKGPRTGFTADMWIENGGAVLAIDANPNLTGLAALVAAGRVLTALQPGRHKAGVPQNGLTNSTGGQSMVIWLADGTSADIVLWWYDDIKQQWYNPSFGALSTITYANNNRAQVSIRNSLGRKHFVQVTAVVGNVKKIAVVIV